MNTADAAGRKHFDPCTMSDPTSGGDGRRAVPSFGNRDWQVSRADLPDVVVFGEFANLCGVQTDF